MAGPTLAEINVVVGRAVVMGNALDKLTIKGFKSIKSLEDFELGKLNIMIGGNGAGKSNFVDIFRMLRAMMNKNFTSFIVNRGGWDDLLFNGPKHTKRIEIKLKFGKYLKYRCTLLPTITENFIIEEEAFTSYTGFGGTESHLIRMKNDKTSIEQENHELLYQLILNLTVYHFHDTSATAPMRRYEITADSARLRSDAANIAPFLRKLRAGKSKS